MGHVCKTFILLSFLTTVAFAGTLSETNPIIFGSLHLQGSGEKSLDLTYDLTLNKKDALGQNFLFTAARIGTIPAAVGSALKSKVIFFERRKNSLLLLV